MAVSSLTSFVDPHPGQRFRATDPTSPLATSELVVDRVVRDALGMLHIVLLDLDRREISLFLEQFEAAVMAGQLAPDREPVRAFA